MLESASKDATGIKFTQPIRGKATGSAPVTEQLNHWIIDATYEDMLNTDSRHLSLDGAGGLVPVFDSNAKARFICQHTPGSFSGTPLEFDVQQTGANKSSYFRVKLKRISGQDKDCEPFAIFL